MKREKILEILRHSLTTCYCYSASRLSLLFAGSPGMSAIPHTELRKSVLTAQAPCHGVRTEGSDRPLLCKCQCSDMQWQTIRLHRAIAFDIL